MTDRQPAGAMRIALFSGNYNYVRDGANQTLNRLAEYLLRQGASVRVYSPTTDTPAFDPVGDLVSVPSMPLPGGRGEYRMALGLPAVIRQDIIDFRPTCLHLAAPDPLGHRVLTLARQRDWPVIASVHTLFETYPAYYGMGFLEAPLVAMLRRFYNRCDALVAPSREIVERLRGQGVTPPINIWSRGVNHERFNPERRDPAWRRALGIGDDEVAIGFLGRIVMEKGLDVFVDAIRELKRRGVAHRVLIIGDGPARDRLASDLPEAVFAGFQVGDDLGRAVASLDLLLQPSVTESFGNVTLEAMAAGVPVIAADATGSRALLEGGRGGVLVGPRDIAAYADVLQHLATDADARRAMGGDGHAEAAAYQWDAINQVVVDTYRAAIAMHQPG